MLQDTESSIHFFFPFLVYDIWPKVLHRSDCFPKSIFYFWKKRWGNLLLCLASPKESLSCNSKFHYKINQDNINTMFNILYFLKLSKKNKQFTKVQISQTVSVITLCNKISQEVSWNRYYNRSFKRLALLPWNKKQENRQHNISVSHDSLYLYARKLLRYQWYLEFTPFLQFLLKEKISVPEIFW